MSTLVYEWRPKPIFTQDWFTSRIPTLTEWLKNYKDKRCHALEIGCFEGRSTLWFLENILTHPNSVLTVIDNFKGGEEHTKEQMEGVKERFLSNTNHLKDKYQLLEGTSDQLLKIDSEMFDFAYIDGSHKSEDVYKDATNVWELIKPFGTMIFDDYEWDRMKDTPKNGIDKFIHEKWNQIHTVVKGYMILVIKGDK